MAERRLAGWGRATWTSSTVAAPRSGPEVSALTRAGDSGRGRIARGLGRSYGDQATNAGGLVIDTTGLGAPAALAISAEGLLDVGAGVSIGQILDVAVPLGWFVPVTPGTRHVTIGGAIAADIHGKNHHVAGTIASHLASITMVLADSTIETCGPATNPDLFWATIGGLGLTGVVISARLQLIAIPSSRLAIDTTRCRDLESLMTAMIEADTTAGYSVAWIDLMATGAATGRSVLTVGDFAGTDAAGDATVTTGPPQLLAAPPWVPNGLVNRITMRAFNEAWFRAAPKVRRDELQSIGRFFYPLDLASNWNRMYGNRGFLQWQVVIPDGHEALLHAIIDTISTTGTPSFLAVLKRFGPENQGPLSFPLKGWTLAADFPTAHPALATMLDGLDRSVADAGGRVYLAKDGRLDPELVASMYPRLDQWRSVRDAVDPERRWQSDMGRRLGL